MSTLTITQDSRGVVVVELNRPERHNAFNVEVIHELDRAFRHPPEGGRVMVLRGAGKSFSAGADVEWMQAQALASEADNQSGARTMAAMFDAIDRCPLPTVALVHGAALGGGTGLTCAVDIALAGPKALFGFTEVRLGIVPAVISPYALRRLGHSQARAWFLLGSRIDAAEALRIGLVHFLDEDPEARLEKLLTELLAGSPAAQRRIKPLVRTVLDAEDATEFTVEQIAAARAHAEGREGLTAFLEKRPAAWTS